MYKEEGLWFLFRAFMLSFVGAWRLWSERAYVTSNRIVNWLHFPVSSTVFSQQPININEILLPRQRHVLNVQPRKIPLENELIRYVALELIFRHPS